MPAVERRGEHAVVPRLELPIFEHVVVSLLELIVPDRDAAFGLRQA